MSGTPKTKRRPSAPPSTSDMDPTELMVAMGGNGWWNPQSNDQITWRLAADDERAVPRAIYRMDAWLAWFTTARGNRLPYANKDGVELHLEHMAADLGIEIHNLRNLWRLGGRKGIWRNGSEAEGAKRLYRRAKVAPVAEPTDDESPKGVCTNPLPTIFQSLTAYMREQLERLSPELLEQAAARYARIETLRDTAHAEVWAAIRMVTDQHEDTLWRELGVEKKRLDERQPKTPEEAELLAARRQRIDAILPHVEGFVQTLDASVQTPKFDVYEGGKGSVQTPASEPTPAVSAPKSNGGGRIRGIDENAPPYPVLERLREGSEEREGVSNNGPAVATDGLHFQDGEKSVHLPAGETVNSAAGKDRLDAFLADVAAMQEASPDRFGAESVHPQNKGDRAWATRIFKTVGPDELPKLIPYWRGRARKGAMGHQATPDILFSWAEDFHRGAAKRRREEEDRAAAAEQQRARDAEREAVREADDKLTVWAEDTWERMNARERDRRVAAETAGLKTDPQWRDWPQTRRAHEAEVRARRKLKQELAAVQAAKGATP